MRLDKYLADMGLGSRSDIKEYVRKGRVTVNRQPVRKADVQILTESDEVYLDGEKVSYVSYEYYMLNKPSGILSASRDRHTTTVVDLIRNKKRKDLFPVGRLDKDTEGLLLITNDGDMSHRLLSPKKHVGKTYFAAVDGLADDDMIEIFAKGIQFEDFKALPAELRILEAGKEESFVEVTVYEGKFHQVKRMFRF